MKKKTLNLRKLSFDKQVIVSLNAEEQHQVYGGASNVITICPGCVQTLQLSNCPICQGSDPLQSKCPISVDPCGIC